MSEPKKPPAIIQGKEVRDALKEFNKLYLVCLEASNETKYYSRMINCAAKAKSTDPDLTVEQVKEAIACLQELLDEILGKK